MAGQGAVSAIVTALGADASIELSGSAARARPAASVTPLTE